MTHITYQDFEKIDIRVGKIVDVQDFPEARRPAYKLWVDFGAEMGIKKTSAQVTQNYTPETLNMSEVLVLGFPDAQGNVTLIAPDKDIPLGGRLY